MGQLSWLGVPPGQHNRNVPQRSTQLRDRFSAALIGLAVGDALGWPLEGTRPGRPSRAALPLLSFIRWGKMVGGRWWGYRDVIEPGEYSDDTQLTLAIARCIQGNGDLDVERFAYEELPLWLQYERGGGRSIKLAARAMLQRDVDWSHNFYSGQVKYRSAGANGAAMRALPVALVSYAHADRLIRDSFRHAIITHGHPRAVLGTLLIAFAYRHALLDGDLADLPLVLTDQLPDIVSGLNSTEDFNRWVQRWDSGQRVGFREQLDSTVAEARSHLIATDRCGDTDEYLQRIGALDPETRGSGIASVCAAVHFASLGRLPAPDRLLAAANAVGTDTDTIGGMVGALVGARLGLDAIPVGLAQAVQDRAYLSAVGEYLYSASFGELGSIALASHREGKREALRRIWAWEIGLHEMFWEAIGPGDRVEHPTLGGGVIGAKSVEKIQREGFAAKLVRVRFDSGQTCVFHSRVALRDGKVAESFAEEISKATRGSSA